MSSDVLHILIALAAIFVGALAAGRLAGLCHVPRVTGYLIVGLLMGPSFANLAGLPHLISPEALDELRLLSQIALSLILVNIGGHFRTENLRRWRWRILRFSLGEMAMTFAAVAGGVVAVNMLFLQATAPNLSLWQTSLYFGLFLGVIGVATAPAATLMVVREYEAEGPVTNTVLSLVGLNNIASILGFVVIAHFLIHPGEGLLPLFGRMFGPIAVGAAFGLALSFWAQRLELPSEEKILLIGGVTAATALCRSLELNSLLASLFLGIVLANSSPRWHRLVASLRQVDYPLYVAFFVLAGANLHIETLGHIGLLGVIYVLARTLGKYAGSALGARMGGFGKRKQAYVGLTLLAQAGVAIGLAATLAHDWPGGGKLLETVVLGSVIVFELFGPLAVRYGLVRAGEVPILSLLQKRAPTGAMEGLHSVVHHFRSSLGLPAGHRVSDPGDILVRHVMRRNVETIRNDTPYNELLRLIAHSRYDRFPVVDGQQHFIGMIDYTEIRDLLFEPSLTRLVVASDLVSARPFALAPDQPLRDALKTLQFNKNVSFFPVVDPDHSDQLLGILSQNDLMAAFRRLGDD